MESGVPEPKFSRSFLNKLIIVLIVAIAVLHALNGAPPEQQAESTTKAELWADQDEIQTLYLVTPLKPQMWITLNAGYLQTPHQPKWAHQAAEFIRKRLNTESKKYPWLNFEVLLNLESIIVSAQFEPEDAALVKDITTKVIKLLKLQTEPPYTPKSKRGGDSLQLFYGQLLAQQLVNLATPSTPVSYHSFLTDKLCLQQTRLILSGKLDKANTKSIQHELSKLLENCDPAQKPIALAAQNILFKQNNSPAMLGIYSQTNSLEEHLGVHLIKHLLLLNFNMEVTENFSTYHRTLLIQNFSPNSFNSWQPDDKTPTFLDDDMQLTKAKEYAAQSIKDDQALWLELQNQISETGVDINALTSSLMSLSQRDLEKLWALNFNNPTTQVNFLNH